MADQLVVCLSPIRDRFMALRGDEATIDATLEGGAERARGLAAPTLAAAYRATGLRTG